MRKKVPDGVGTRKPTALTTLWGQITLVGELCFDNPDVRGYINLPEETEKAFQNGIYHTGDLARLDENGD